jgi:hypothetical protein
MRAALLSTAVIGFLLGAFAASASARSDSPSIAPVEAKDASEAARSAWRARVEAARARYEAFAARAETAFRDRQPARLRDPIDSEPLSAALDDPTLRYNDLIVAPDGVFVFRGAEGARHSPDDFERLPEARVRALSLRTFDKTN